MGTWVNDRVENSLYNWKICIKNLKTDVTTANRTRR